MGRTRNSLGIKYVTGGPPQLRATLNEIIAGMDRVLVRRSVDIDAVDNPDGTLLTIRNPLGTAGRGRGNPRTLLVYNASTTGPDVAQVGVTFGQINGVTPTISGTAIGGATPPVLTVVTGAIYLHATVDGDGVITALTIENAATRPADTATDGYLTLAQVIVASDVITLLEHAAWNLLELQVCNEQYLWGGFGE